MEFHIPYFDDFLLFFRLVFFFLFKPCFGFHLSGSQSPLFGAFFTALAMSVFI